MSDVLHDARMDPEKTVYRRSELYDLVWSEPMTNLAPRFGVSDVALAKTCRRLGIPLPGVGHWTKIARGHVIERPPLPPPTHEQPDELIIERHEAPVRLAPVDPIPEVKVSDQLRNPHALVAKTKQALQGSKTDTDGRFHPRHFGGLDLLVGPSSLSRALRIMDAMLKHLEGSGHRVSVQREKPFATRVRIGNQDVAFQLREGLIRTKRLPTERDPYPYPRFESDPNGVFTLEIKEYVSGVRKVWVDGKRHRMEELIGAFFAGLKCAAAVLQVWADASEKARREREAEQIRQAELEAQRREEQRKVDALLDQLKRWRRSEGLRDYVAAVRDAAVARYGSVEEGSELDQWMKWALGVADRVDPLRVLKGIATE